MFLAVDLHKSEVYVSSHRQGLVKPSKMIIRGRKIALSVTAVSATRPDTPAPPGTRRPRRDGCVHRLVFDDVNANDGAWRDEDVLASGLSRVAVEPAPKRRRRRGGEPAVRFTAPISERQAVQGQYDEQNRRP